MNRLENYFDPYYYNYVKQAAQPPMGGDPAAMGGMPPGGGMPMDPSMMGGGMPMDPSMMGGMPPGGGMPMDPSMMGAMMGAAPPPAPPVDPAAAADPAAAEEAAAPKTAKQQKEELMNNIQSSLESIQDYVYNNLMILIQVAKTLNVQIPAEMLVAPPNGKNMDIMNDPESIAAAGGQGGGAPADGSMPPGMEDITMPPAEQAPSEAKVAMFRLAGIPSKQVEGHQIKKAMDYLINRDKHNAISAMHNLIGGNK